VDQARPSAEPTLPAPIIAILIAISFFTRFSGLQTSESPLPSAPGHSAGQPRAARRKNAIGKAQFRSLAQPWADTDTNTGRLMLAVSGGLADVERDLIRTAPPKARAAPRIEDSTWGGPFPHT
jgi:hypothetical protein